MSHCRHHNGCLEEDITWSHWGCHSEDVTGIDGGAQSASAAMDAASIAPWWSEGLDDNLVCQFLRNPEKETPKSSWDTVRSQTHIEKHWNRINLITIGQATTIMLFVGQHSWVAAQLWSCIIHKDKWVEVFHREIHYPLCTPWPVSTNILPIMKGVLLYAATLALKTTPWTSQGPWQQ